MIATNMGKLLNQRLRLGNGGSSRSERRSIRGPAFSEGGGIKVRRGCCEESRKRVEGLDMLGRGRRERRITAKRGFCVLLFMVGDGINLECSRFRAECLITSALNLSPAEAEIRSSNLSLATRFSF